MGDGLPGPPIAAAAVGLPVTLIGAGVTFEKEMTMLKPQELVKSAAVRAASSATLMAVVVVVVGAGKKFF